MTFGDPQGETFRWVVQPVCENFMDIYYSRTSCDAVYGGVTWAMPCTQERPAYSKHKMEQINNKGSKGSLEKEG